MRAQVIVALAAACLLSACGPNAFPGVSALDPSVDAAGNTPPPVDELAQAQADFRARNFGLADSLYRKIIAREPNNANAWLGLGAVDDELARFDLADQDYAQVARLSGTTAALLNDRGYSYMLRGDYKRASEFLAQAEAMDPQNVYIARNLQLLHQRLDGSSASASSL